jgi:SagB-type dehydrogenase family enzyme
MLKIRTLQPAPTPAEPPPLSELYHENSKQQRYNLDFSRRISFVNKNTEIHRVISKAGKSYPGAKKIALPAVTDRADGPTVEQVVAQRRSIRHFARRPLTLDEVSRLLHFGSGITGYLPSLEHGLLQPVRATPSGGALYPVELYVVMLADGPAETGVYHYHVSSHGLEMLSSHNLTDALARATSDPALFVNAGLVIILTGLFAKTTFKYGERGYRFVLFEAGHIAQNILLEATALGLGAVPVAGFVDDEVNALLDLNGVDEASLYLIVVGQPDRSPGQAYDGAQAVVSALLEDLWNTP